MFSHNLKDKIENNIDAMLSENASIVKRNFASEILLIFRKRLLKILEFLVYIIFWLYRAHTLVLF